MGRRFGVVLAALMAGVLVGGLLPATATTGQRRGPAHSTASTAASPIGAHTIRLASGGLDTSTAPPSVTFGDAETVFVVQFDGPVTAADRSALNAAADVYGYLPDNAFKVRGSMAAASAVPGVHWVGTIPAELKIHPDVPLAGTDAQMVRIVLEPTANGSALVDDLVALGTPAGMMGDAVIVAADAPTVEQLAARSDIAWIEPFQLPQTYNEDAGDILGVPDALAAGYDGSTQIVAVADTGLGDGTQAGAHRDIPDARISAILDYPAQSVAGCYTAIPDGAQDVDSGHGTHVAGSVLSDGGTADLGRGSAPGATLVFQSLEDWAAMSALCELLIGPSAYILGGLSAGVGTVLQDAYDLGARIHSDSWGSNSAGEYTDDASTIDAFVWANPDLLPVFAAGNSGTDSNVDGVVDDGSIGSPAVAKNVLAIGASENDRTDGWACDASLTYAAASGTTCADQGGANDIFTWSAAWPDDFSVAPLADDPSAGNAEQMASFSSRGPTSDGRIKPDLVAPGSWVLSAYSDMYQQEYDATVNPQNGAFQYDGWGFPYDEHYKYMGGTSMATPLAAGAAVVVRDFYEVEFDWSASAALVKATLINSARDLADENNDGADDNDFPIPNSHEGWGIIDVGAATDLSHEWLEAAGLSTGQSTAYAVVADGAAPLKVTIVWTDPAPASGAATSLVNDLDLVVVAPDGTTTHIGNNFSGGWTTAGVVAADSVNNVENVYIEAPTAGTWTVQVHATNVPDGPQPYALVVDGAGFADTDTTPPEWPAGAALQVDAVTLTTITFSWPAAADNVGVVAYDVTIDGMATATVTDTSVTVTDLEPFSDYLASVSARDAAGNTSALLQGTITPGADDEPPDWSGAEARVIDIGEDFVTFAWDYPSDVSPIDVFVIGGVGTEPMELAPPASFLTVDGLLPDTLYQFTINARDSNGNTSLDGPVLAVVTAPDFGDTNGSAFEAEIAWLAAMGITSGCDDEGNFCPNDHVTRAQMATFLARALGLDPVPGTRFDDVSGVHAENINAVADAGITLGCTSDGTMFCPNDLVRRDQMATFLNRAFAFPDATANHFIDDEGSVHEDAINAIAEAGVTQGCGGLLYCPAEFVTRGQMAAFLKRAFEA